MWRLLAAVLSAWMVLPGVPGEALADQPLMATGGSDVSPSVHFTVTSSSSTYLDNTEANFSIAYSVDYGSVAENDYIVISISPSSAFKDVLPAASSQHFKSVIDLGGGQYKLVFGPNAPTVVSGTIDLYTMANNKTDEDIDATVQAGDASKTVTVKHGEAGGGTVGEDTNRLIYKDGPWTGQYGPSDKDMYGYYNVSSEPQSIMFRIAVDEMHVNMTNTVVTDVIPDGMAFDPSSVEVAWTHNTASSTEVTPLADDQMAQVGVTQDGQTVTFSLGDLLANIEDEPTGSHHYIRIIYYATIPANTKVAYTNSANLDATYDDVHVGETTTYTVRPRTGGSGTNEWKTVDKTSVSGDDDQLVTYRLYVWIDSAAKAGSIVTEDQLDPNVTFVGASLTPYLDVICDSNNVVHITNPVDIQGNKLLTVEVTVSMEDVPEGYGVVNVFGDSRVVTYKDVSCRAEGTKTVNGSSPDGLTFKFDLVDADGTVVQTVESDADGSFSFDGLTFSADDAGTTFTYTVRENAQSAERYAVTPSEYTVEVTPAKVDDGESARLVAVPVFRLDDEAVSQLAFDNVPITTSLTVEKVWRDASGNSIAWPDGAEVVVTLLEGGVATSETLTLTADSPRGTFTDLIVMEDGEYSVEETQVTGVSEGYSVTVTGSEDEGFVVTNTAPEEPDKPEKPEGPEKPEEPYNPEEPTTPGTPTTPGKPTTPTKPTAPSTPPKRAELPQTGDASLDLVVALAQTGLLMTLSAGLRRKRKCIAR